MDSLFCKICESDIGGDEKKVTVKRVRAKTTNTLARQRGVNLVVADGDILHKNCQVKFTRKDRTVL